MVACVFKHVLSIILIEASVAIGFGAKGLRGLRGLVLACIHHERPYTGHDMYGGGVRV